MTNLPQLTKPASEYSSEERRSFYVATLRAVRASMTPSMPGRFSGQQVAYAKGRASQHMSKLGF